MLKIIKKSAKEGDIDNLTAVIYHQCQIWKRIIERDKAIATESEMKQVYKGYFIAIRIAIGRYQMITKKIDWSWAKQDAVAKYISDIPLPISFDMIRAAILMAYDENADWFEKKAEKQTDNISLVLAGVLFSKLRAYQKEFEEDKENYSFNSALIEITEVLNNFSQIHNLEWNDNFIRVLSRKLLWRNGNDFENILYTIKNAISHGPYLQ